MTVFDHQAGEHLQLSDAQLYFEVAGNPAGKPLVLLHGGLGSLADFNSIAPQLAGEFRLIGIDFRGQGRSTLGSAPLTYQLYQADVEAVLSQLGIERFSILGFSDGGITAYRLAVAAPARVEALITIGAPWQLLATDPVFELLEGLTAERWRGFMGASIDYYESVNPAPDLECLISAIKSLWTDTGASGYPGATIDKITAPTLIVRGDADDLFSIGDASGCQAQIAGSSFLNLPFAGHEAHKDVPEVFVAVAREFLLRPKRRPQF